MVTYELQALLPFGNGVSPRRNPIRNQTKADSDEALLYEVELRHLLILIVDQLVIVIGREGPWHKPVRNVAEHGPLVQSV
jgi:hypothetical protein